MAYDAATLPATDEQIAIDKIAGKDFQRVKPAFGAEGSATDVSPANPMPVVDAGAATALATLHTDLATTLAGYVDGLETLIGTSNTSLASILTALSTTIAGYVDGLETLTTSSNTKLDTIHTDLGTTLSGLLSDLKGYTDGLETLTTASNTKLDTLHTDIATTLAAYVDGLETLSTSTNTKLDTLHTDIANSTLPAGAGTAAAAGRVTLASDDPAVAALGATSGAKVVTDAAGTIQQYLRGLVTFFVNALGAGTAAAAHRVTLASDDPLVAQAGNLVKVPAKSTKTRPGDTTAYSIADLMANNTTAGSVTRFSWTGATISGNGGKGTITGCTFGHSGANSFAARIHFLKTDHAVTNGDNGALVLTSLDADNYIGFVDIVCDGAQGGGKMGFSSCAIDYELATGDTIYAVAESLSGWTPANAGTFFCYPRVRRYS